MMTRTVTIPFREPPSEMTREEILKQVAHLNNSLRRARISPDGNSLLFEVPAEEADRVKAHAEQLCAQIQRSLRRLARKVVYRTRAMSHPAFRGTSEPTGVYSAGQGQIMLEGIPLRVFQQFDTALANLEKQWAPQPLITPTLIPASVLAKCYYFSSFPNTLTFACHLRPDAGVLNAFRARHEGKSGVDAESLADMAPPEVCLSPAVCYHVYHRTQGMTLPRDGLVYGVRGKCFRYEASNMRGLMRLWDFTMRELVFLGTSENVLQQRERCVEIIGGFLDELGLAAEIRTASDPFYIAPEAFSKTYFQLTAETKYEISALLPENERLAVGSLNYHNDFFGRTFDIDIENVGPAHSMCIGFGLERLVCAFLAQHGSEPSDWPQSVNTSDELAEVAGVR